MANERLSIVERLLHIDNTADAAGDGAQLSWPLFIALTVLLVVTQLVRLSA